MLQTMLSTWLSIYSTHHLKCSAIYLIYSIIFASSSIKLTLKSLKFSSSFFLHSFYLSEQQQSKYLHVQLSTQLSSQLSTQLQLSYQLSYLLIHLLVSLLASKHALCNVFKHELFASWFTSWFTLWSYFIIHC